MGSGAVPPTASSDEEGEAGCEEAAGAAAGACAAASAPRASRAASGMPRHATLCLMTVCVEQRST